MTKNELNNKLAAALDGYFTELDERNTEKALTRLMAEVENHKK